MLTTTTDSNTAITTRQVHDITEAKPIPKGSRVDLLDFDPCGDVAGLWIVEYAGRVYQAAPEELKP